MALAQVRSERIPREQHQAALRTRKGHWGVRLAADLGIAEEVTEADAYPVIPHGSEVLVIPALARRNNCLRGRYGQAALLRALWA